MCCCSMFCSLRRLSPRNALCELIASCLQPRARKGGDDTKVRGHIPACCAKGGCHCFLIV